VFFCEKCRIDRDLPGIIPTAHGACEFCGKVAPCYDVASEHLPLAPPEERVVFHPSREPGDAARVRADGRVVFVGSERNAKALVAAYIGKLRREQEGVPASPDDFPAVVREVIEFLTDFAVGLVPEEDFPEREKLAASIGGGIEVEIVEPDFENAAAIELDVEARA
jgi:hypothetical protein